MARLVSGTPARSIGVRRRGVAARVRLAEGGRVDAESSLERDLLRSLDFRDDVISVREQPMKIRFELNGRQRAYTPDVIAQFRTPKGTRTVVYEIKVADELHQNWAELKPRFRAAMRYCRERGWKFKLMTEKQIRTPFLANARFLRPYLHIQPDLPSAERLLYTLRALGPTTPQALLVASYWDDKARMAALPMLWHLVACRAILVGLDEHLTMNSLIWERMQ